MLHIKLYSCKQYIYSAINQQKSVRLHYTKAEQSEMSPNKDERSTLELSGVVRSGKERSKD